MDLKQYRKEIGFHLREMAELLGVNPNTYQAIEYGFRRCTPDLAARIEAATHGAVTAAELLAHLIPPGYSLVRVEDGEPVEHLPPSPVDGQVVRVES